MNHKRFLELFNEFGAELSKVSTLYLDSLAGYSLLHTQVMTRQQEIAQLLGDTECSTEEFQDTCSVSYEYLSGDTFSPVSMRPTMKQGDVKQRTAKDGYNSLRLGELCLVALYSYWEEYLRLEVGIAFGVLPIGSKRSEKSSQILNVHVKYDIWGDLRLLRHFIVHNVGVCGSDIEKCKLIKWFRAGDRIELDRARMRQIFIELAVFRNELHTLSFPPRKLLTVPHR